MAGSTQGSKQRLAAAAAMPMTTAPAAANDVTPPGLVERLFRGFGPGLLRYLARRTHDPDVAADLAQETFMRIAQHPSPATIRNPEAFAQRVASNLLRDDRRRARRRSAATALIDIDIALPPDQHRRLEAREALVRYRRALEALPPRTRQVFLMQRFDGLTYRQIAEHLSVSTSAVEKHMMTAIAAIDRADAQR